MHCPIFISILQHRGNVTCASLEICPRNASAFFCKLAFLGEKFPSHTIVADKALRCQTGLSLGRSPDKLWKRRAGRPHKQWLDQIRDDNRRPPTDVWRDAVILGRRNGLCDNDSDDDDK